ncbi:MAG: AGE family epimerase/isomerase [Propionibacteriaceae bacterium]|jgi:sulfoquinovose isomerase|nr:AGE family epimerase/isomerase [Propionibacteriaceae bacterium]
MRWLGTASHTRWLEQETDRVLEFARAARNPDGFGWLDVTGCLAPDQPDFLWVTARMTHAYAVAALLGRPGANPLVDHGLACLAGGTFRDEQYGGWYTAVHDGRVVDDTKAGYPHLFVVLAGASAVAAGRPGGRELLTEALRVTDAHFWSADEQMVRESWDRTFTTTEAYRGGNVSMHATEAYLAVADVLDDPAYLHRALAIAHTLIHTHARANHYRVFEHFDESWRPLPDYNRDHPAHRFRAYGSTPGHWAEWTRLLLHLRAGLAARGETPPDWLLEDARGLFDACLRDAWQPDGHPGFVYSVDWQGHTVVPARIRWVLAEAIGGAYALYRATGEPVFEDWYIRFWDVARTTFMDLKGGSWWQELSPAGVPSSAVWDGKPDIYHLLHALVVPRLPLTPALAPALAQGALDAA